MTALSDAVADGLEPDAKDMIGKDGASDMLVAVASIAISLRRLADTDESVVDFAHNAPAIRTRRD